MSQRSFLGHLSFSRAYSLIVLSLLSQSVPAQNDAAQRAVRAAQETPLPDTLQTFKDVSGQAPEYLAGFGAASLSTLNGVRDLYRDGQGLLAAPASRRVSSCRNASDTECLAVQVLDRGFANRPEIDEVRLSAHDDIVNASALIPPPSSPATSEEACFALNITTAPVERTQSCAVGAPLIDATCLSGFLSEAPQRQTRWRCQEQSARQTSLSCLVTSDFAMISQNTQRCFYGGDTLTAGTTIREKVSAEVSAIYRGTCYAPRKTLTTITCSDLLTPSVGETCSPGTFSSVTVRGDEALMKDACPGADQLTIKKECRTDESSARKRRFIASLNGGWKAVTLTGATPSGSVRFNTCRADLSGRHDCNDTSCTITLTATLYKEGPGSASFMGSISALYAYTPYSAKGVKDVWLNGCEALQKEMQGEEQ